MDDFSTSFSNVRYLSGLAVTEWRLFLLVLKIIHNFCYANFTLLLDTMKANVLSPGGCADLAVTYENTHLDVI